MGIKRWSVWLADTKAIYWMSIPPEFRNESRPNPPEGEPAVPDDIWQAVIMVYPTPDSWLNNPIPAIGGKTPLQAIASGQADKVREAIQGVASFFLPDPSEVRPYSATEATLSDGDSAGDDAGGGTHDG